ncbi:MAG: protein kinase domain-containing protein, partial [Terriglobales bacterium]
GGSNQYYCDCAGALDDARESTSFIEKFFAKLSATPRRAAEAQRKSIDDHYMLGTMIGQGAHSSVHEAEETATGRKCAIKILRPELINNAATVQRFEQESRSIRAIAHKNIVQIYDSGVLKNESPFIVMELLRGETLAGIIKHDGALPPRRAVNIFTQVCSAISAAHAAGVVHRDLKPSNIVIARSESSEDVVKIIDFGIARMAPEAGGALNSLTQTGEIFGSPFYMSPEQCTGDYIDERCDIYSIGCVMCEALTGRPPFVGDNPIRTILKHINNELTDLISMPELRALPADLQKIIVRCLQKERHNRYQSADELKQDLERVQAGQPLPPALVRQASSFSQPRKPKIVRAELNIVLPILSSLVTLIIAVVVFSLMPHQQSVPQAKPGVSATNPPTGAGSYVPHKNPEDTDNGTYNRIDWHNRGVTDSDLQELAGRDVYELNLNHNQINDRSMLLLAKLPLVDLFLSETHVGDFGLEQLCNIKTLSLLEMNRTHISDGGLKSLWKLERLRTLRLDDNHLSDECCAYIARLPNLESISLKHMRRITDEGAARLTNNALLHTLRLSGTSVTDKGMAKFTSIPLRTVELESTAITNKTIK